MSRFDPFASAAPDPRGASGVPASAPAGAPRRSGPRWLRPVEVGSTSVWRVVTVMALSVTGLFSAFGLAVLTAQGQRVEERILDISSYNTESALLGLVSVPSLVVACVVVAGIALLQRRIVAAATGVAVIAVSNFLGQLLKYAVFERPAFLDDVSNTFPSGHMIAFASAAVAVLLVIPARLRGIAALLATVLLCAVGFELLSAGWHRPSDVIGSLFLVCAVAAAAVLVPGGAVPARTHASARRLSGLLTTVSFVLGFVGVGAALVVALGLFDGADAPVAVFGYSAVLAVALFTVGLLLWVMPVARADRGYAAADTRAPRSTVSGHVPHAPGRTPGLPGSGLPGTGAPGPMMAGR